MATGGQLQCSSPCNNPTMLGCTLQVNRSPSFSTDAPLDLEIKNGVLSDAFRLLNVKCVVHV